MLDVLTKPVVDHVTSQFQRPRGFLGPVVGRIMSRRNSNAQRNLWLVELLELEPTHRVLEIGPGPGVAIEAAAQKVTEGQLVAIDHSTTMLRQTRQRNEHLIAEGRLTLIQSPAQTIPADVTGFDRIYCMNVWHFWDDQEAVLAGLVERLAPDGWLAVGYQPRHPGATEADAVAGMKCLRDQLAEVGLVEISDHRVNLAPMVVAVIGRKP